MSTTLWLSGREPVQVDTEQAKKHGLRSGEDIGPGQLAQIQGQTPTPKPSIIEAATKAYEENQNDQTGGS